MAIIQYDFPGIPEQPNDEELRAASLVLQHADRHDEEHVHEARGVAAKRQAYLGIYQDLKERGFPVPAQAPEEITRAQLVEHLREVVTAALRAELELDPDDIYPDETVVAAAGGDRAAAQYLADLVGQELSWERVDITPAGAEEEDPPKPRIFTWRERAVAFGDKERRLEDVEPDPSKPFADHVVSHPLARALRIPHAPNVITAADVITALGGK